MSAACWLDWSVDVFLCELAKLHESGWDGIGYMMAGQKPPEKLFFVAGDEAFHQEIMLRAALEMHQLQGRVPFLRYYFSQKPDAPRVKQELWRETENGNTVVAELVVSVDQPDFFERTMESESSEYLLYRARLGCLQVLDKLNRHDIGSVSPVNALQGLFGQGGTQ